MNAIGLVSWMWRPAWRLREIGWGDIVFAALLSAWVVILCGVKAGPHAGVAASIVALAMTHRGAGARVGAAEGAGWSPGVGLVSMRDRAAELGGWCAAGPGPVGGRVTASLPIGDASPLTGLAVGAGAVDGAAEVSAS